MTDLPGQMTENVGQHDLAPRRRMQIRYRFTALVHFMTRLLAKRASRREEVPLGKQPVAVGESRHRPSGSRRRWPKSMPARLHAGILYVCTAQSARSLMPAAYSQMSRALRIRTRTYGSRPPYWNHVGTGDLADSRPCRRAATEGSDSGGRGARASRAVESAAPRQPSHPQGVSRSAGSASFDRHDRPADHPDRPTCRRSDGRHASRLGRAPHTQDVR